MVFDVVLYATDEVVLNNIHVKRLAMKKSLDVLTLGSVVVLITLVISGINPFDRVTWWMEVMPVLIGFPVLWLMRRGRSYFEFTQLVYVLICAQALVLIVGGMYSYARVPLGFWLQDFFGLTRNPYDKIGHFMQGFVPAMVAREWLLRHKWVNGNGVASFVGICVALSVSLIYELIEWFAALMLGQGAEEFLGTQGDIWDTQSDMLFALIGACVAIVLLGRWHNRQIRQMVN